MFKLISKLFLCLVVLLGLIKGDLINDTGGRGRGRNERRRDEENGDVGVYNTPYNTLFTPYITPHNTPYTIHYTLYTIHYTLYTLPEEKYDVGFKGGGGEAFWADPTYAGHRGLDDVSTVSYRWEENGGQRGEGEEGGGRREESGERRVERGEWREVESCREGLHV